MHHNSFWYPIFPNDMYYLAIHSPNMIPLLENFITIEPGSYNIMEFSFVRVELINDGRIEMCQVYDNGYEHATRRECIIKCVTKKLHINIRNIWDIMDDELVRFDFFKQYTNDYLINVTRLNLGFRKEIYRKLIDTCTDACKSECRQSIYIYDYEVFSKREVANYFNPSTNIEITHSRIPDVIVRHMPENTLISFISNFGGLLGLWLGLSVSSLGTGILLLKRIISESMLNKNGRDNQARNNHFHNHKFIFPFFKINIVNIVRKKRTKLCWNVT